MASNHKTDLSLGLTTDQVRDRIRAGQVNAQPPSASKSIPRILRDNVLTFFNLINAVLGALVLWVGAYKNALFLMVIFFNTVIGVVQELRAKLTLDRLTLLTAAKVNVVRDGREIALPMDQLVLDDIMILSAGMQICADAQVREGTLEVNESLLTGESEAVVKQPGDKLLAGSFVISGRARAQAEVVGLESYAARLAAEAKRPKRQPSELRDAMNRILKTVSIVILPLGAGFFLRQHVGLGLPTDSVIVGTVAAVLGMIPEGLVLLTSIALALGVINLGRRRTLVRELFCIETLARVDVMCLDKTGTLTQGSMQVKDVEPLCQGADVDAIMGNLMRVLPDGNETFLALKHRFPQAETMEAGEVLAFSSARKYSGARFVGRGAYLIGAYECLIPPKRWDAKIVSRIEEHAGEGKRVLALVQGGVTALDKAAEAELEPVALILITDVIRPDAAETLRYFREQDTRLIILSGDHPATVAAIAGEVGFPDAERHVDASTLLSDAELSAAVEQFGIFGRVKPDQKRQLIKALKAAGHTVAMVGDGVNDVPALKEADCSIAMAQGSDAAKQCANLVLLNSGFSALPHVVNEGRRVINNIQSAASLFLVKTMFSVLLTAIMLIFLSPYPFIPIHLTLIGACAVGIPTFIFAFEPDHHRIGKEFFGAVLKNALTGALVIVLWICVSTLFSRALGWGEGVRSTMCVIATGLTSLSMISRVYRVDSLLRRAVYLGVHALFFGALWLLPGFLGLGPLGYAPAVLVIAMVCGTGPLLDAASTFGSHIKMKTE